MKLKLSFLVVLLVFMFACATTYQGRNMDSGKMQQLTAGSTGEERVTELFGKPDQVEKLPSGAEKYIYLYGYSRDISHWWTIDSIDSQRLEIEIKDGVVQGFNFREDGKEAYLKEAALSPADIRERGKSFFREDNGGMGDRKRDEIIKSQTTEKQVWGILGTPAAVERSPSGKSSTYTYQYYFERFSHWYQSPDYDRQTLVVAFADGVVDHYHFTREYRGDITKQDQ